MRDFVDEITTGIKRRQQSLKKKKKKKSYFNVKRTKQNKKNANYTRKHTQTHSHTELDV